MRSPLPFVLFLSGMLPVAAHAQVPVGGEFQVNTFTTEDQKAPSVAMDPTGRFVVVWTSGYWRPPLGPFISRGIYGRHYDPSGDPLEGEFEVAYDGFRGPKTPSVTAGAEGGFVVVWQQYADVQARRFGNDGTAVGGAFRVNTSRVMQNPAVAADAAGNFVVAWDAGTTAGPQALTARLFDADDNPQGGEFEVVGITSPAGDRPSVARDAAGNFVVVWSSYRPGDGSGGAIFARRYDAAGTALGAPFVVNSHTTGSQDMPVAAMNAQGRMVVAWTRPTFTSYTEPLLYAVSARVYDPSGEPLGPDVPVISDVRPAQLAAAMDDDGSFVVAWDDRYAQGDILARRFDASGVPASAEFRVSSYTTGGQSSPAIATDGRGNFVVTWTRWSGGGFKLDVFGQRFGPDLIFADDFESGTLSAWSSSGTDGGDLAVSPSAAMRHTRTGAEGHVNDGAPLYVQDDSPRGEDRYHARFYFNPGDFDPGEAQGHFRARIFVGFEENPTRRLFAVVARRRDGQYAVMARARRDDDTQSNGGFVPIGPGPHFIELAWTRAVANGGQGSFQMWVDGAPAGGDTALDNARGALDFVRLGALGLKAGASGTMYWDEFESRRASSIGP